MTVDSNSNLSFFQIAGIHGAPYIPYDGAGVQHVEPTPEFLGYCSHASVLFPTWHRPYMALIEQELQRVALDIAQRYTNFKEDWVDAAIQLRFPYWDWSSTARPPRELYTQPKLTVALPPLGQSDEIDNPFLLYRFQQKPADFPSPFVLPAWNSVTHRYGKVNASTGVVEDDIEALERALSDNGLKNRRDGTGRLLLSNTIATWEPFSNDNQGRFPEAAPNSLEKLHGNIHWFLGGGGGRGHLSSPPVAAFDPFFFIHHSQTDRLLALWMAMHPDAWVTASKENKGTWTIQAGGAVDATTPLTPFYCTGDGQFWSSEDLQAPTDGLFGYSYPDFDGIVDWSDKVAVQNKIRAHIEALYPFAASVKLWLAFDAGASQSLCPPLPPTAATAAIPAYYCYEAARAVLAWSAHITVKKFALRGSFSVSVFLGDPPSDPEDYAASPNFVGDYAAFAHPTPERCANCTRIGDITVGGEVELTRVIVERAEVASLHPDEVVPYLRRELCWRVWTGSGPAVHPAQVEELQIDVSATPHYLADEGEVVVGEPVVYHEVTRGLPGGCRHSD
ncbi:Tyrosinase [Trametes pubescens]|uniref:tyrosinase n=1 Tax=Trametes pubescens TaxID=154538 RepID=A0A1M2V476_TRAPU|nr:Tyrosinase [Trametes pubescens]